MQTETRKGRGLPGPKLMIAFILPCFVASLAIACSGTAKSNLFGPAGGSNSEDDASTSFDADTPGYDASIPSEPDAQIADAFVADQFIADSFVADTFVADTYVAPTMHTIPCGSSQCVAGQQVCCDEVGDEVSSMCMPSASQCIDNTNDGVPLSCAQTADCRTDGGVDVCCLSISQSDQTESARCSTTCASSSSTQRYQLCAGMDTCLPTTSGVTTCQPSNAVLPGYSLCQ
jgi:hypothetical protein